MTDDALTDAGAQIMRRYWFTYLDTIEPVQGVLHAFCLKLTSNLWDAEDLVQDTLLRGFAMTARGDFHGEASPVRNIKAYLFRTATNLWLDIQRRKKWQVPLADAAEPVTADADPAVTADALRKAATLTTAQEFAAILLKDAYDFTLEETADFIGTTPGTVKSALSRARRKMRVNIQGKPVDPRRRALIHGFVDAMNSKDIDRILNLLSETVKVDVCNVGGGRGRSGIWTQKTLPGIRCEYAEHDGEPLVLLFGEHDRVVSGVVRLEGSGDSVTRIIDYYYAADTLRHLAGAQGLECAPRGYHQSPEALPEMVATTGRGGACLPAAPPMSASQAQANGQNRPRGTSKSSARSKQKGRLPPVPASARTEATGVRWSCERSTKRSRMPLPRNIDRCG
jgi:RNA polymerase sigma-70 factor (ECF subfamily)